MGKEDAGPKEQVEEAPASFELSELVNVLVMLSTAMQCLEGNAQVQSHLALPPGKRALRRTPRPPLQPRRPHFRRVATRVGLSVCGVALGLGLWRHFTKSNERQEAETPGLTAEGQTPPGDR